MRAKRTDDEHQPVLDAIRDVLGWACASLHTQGCGVEDILVAVPPKSPDFTPLWLMLEVKTARNKRREVTPGQYTSAQLKWRNKTCGWPRITAVDAEDAIRQLREWA
jgi:hypothetical protein